MLRWTRRQRQVLVEELPDLANLVIGGLVVGQFLGERPFSMTLAFVGIAVWVVLTGFAIVVARDQGDL